MDDIYAEFTMRVRVYDKEALREEAEHRAVENNLSIETWRAMRDEHPTGPIAADLIMLLDPGSLMGAGCEIHDSHASTDEFEMEDAA